MDISSDLHEVNGSINRFKKFKARKIMIFYADKQVFRKIVIRAHKKRRDNSRLST
ncbi:hypothetical protein FACS189463_2520 [Bacteroidia bacterium]|nr:hypothetical protein FACS189463_2520 [Bacteroidia bacterium]